jgi:peptidoglycan/xylan/chitin deacetylase (PgdA/CDA1 family)
MTPTRLLGTIAAVACAASCLGQTRSAALTFDDLPAAGSLSGAEAQRVNRAILAALAKHRAPSIGFVIEEKVRKMGAGGREILREWLDNGQELGNHTFSHSDLNVLTLDQFRSEVIAGEGGRRMRFLRFPFNHSGATREKHDAVAAFLAARGYSVAACTIDNSDYEFARAYDAMLLRGDRKAADKLEAEYLAYTGAGIDYYSELDRKVFGREIPHVMLLHVSRLNASVLERVLGLFEIRGYRFVSLAKAQSDPAYRTPEAPSEAGPMWGYRWAKALRVPVDGRLEPEVPEWVLKYGR